MKTCENCKYFEFSTNAEPCKTCTDIFSGKPSNWVKHTKFTKLGVERGRYKHKEPESLWSIAIEMANRIADVTEDRDLVARYRSRLQSAYWDEQERRRAEYIRENGYIDPWS